MLRVPHNFTPESLMEKKNISIFQVLKKSLEDKKKNLLHEMEHQFI